MGCGKWPGYRARTAKRCENPAKEHPGGLEPGDHVAQRRYVDRARSCGLDRDGDACQLTDELLAAVIAGVRPSQPNGISQAWETIAAQHDQIKAWLDQGLTLTKVHTLLGRRGVVVSYRTLHRYAKPPPKASPAADPSPLADSGRTQRRASIGHAPQVNSSQ
jgi:hypothetical protein